MNDVTEVSDYAGAFAQFKVAYQEGRYLDARDLGLAVLGEIDQAEQEMRAATPPGREPDSKSKLMVDKRMAMRLLSLVCCEAGDFDTAFAVTRRFGEFARAIDCPDADLDAAFARAACLDRVGDPWNALSTLNDAIERSGLDAEPASVMIAMNTACALGINLWHFLGGHSRNSNAANANEAADVLVRARSASEAAKELLDGTSDPNYRAVINGNLGEVLTLQGHYDLGLKFLNEGLAYSINHNLHAVKARIEATMALWLLRNGQLERAQLLANEVLSKLTPRDPIFTRIHLLRTLQDSSKALGQWQTALDASERLQMLERELNIRFLRAQTKRLVFDT